MAQYAFIGYDLGDGETITDIAVLDYNQMQAGAKTMFIDMTMPDNNTPGQAIPTAFGYDAEGNVVLASSILSDPEVINDIHNNFKRCPTDLVRRIDENRKSEIMVMLEKGMPNAEQCPELNTEKMNYFAESVRSFTNAIFNDPKFSKRIHDAAADCESIVFCVGHPTRWTDFDVEIYKAIISKSILGNGYYMGKPASIVMAAESRAAFLYVKNRTAASILPKDTSALLVDIGSSTIDVTAMAADSRNHQYNSGSNYLGARSIDFLIRDKYLKQLMEDEDDRRVYNELITLNPTMEKALVLCCRKSKEEVFSTAAKKSKIIFADFPPMKLSQDDVTELVKSKPIGSVLCESIGLPKETAEIMGNNTWTKLFKDFLSETKSEMSKRGINVGRIMLTGSASKMPFVRDIIKEVFYDVPEELILDDMNPSRSISMGLALVGPFNMKSQGFQKAVADIMETEVAQCVRDNLPVLADNLGSIIEKIVIGIVKRRLEEWRRGEIKTLNDMTVVVSEDCSEENINALLSDSHEYNEAINDWTINMVGNDIAIKLKNVCDRYGVSELTLDELNVMKISSINIDGIDTVSLSNMDDIMNAVVAVLSVIAGIITAVILPTVLGVVIGLLSFISVNFAAMLFAALMALPGIGFTILIGVAGVAAFNAVRNELGDAKEKIIEKLKSADLPAAARKMVSDEKINKKLAEAGMQEKIKEAILDEKSQESIVASVSQNLNRQIAKRMDDIKYVIESR